MEKVEQSKPNKYADIRNIPFGEPLPMFATPTDDVLQTLSFNEKTKFSNPLPAQKLLESAKEPPLHTREINKMGISGKGVNVAIIDQPLALDHPEYKGQIRAYKSFCAPDQISSMHGPAVASSLVGKTIGVAPDANLFYVAIPTWEFDAKYAALALDWILQENKKLPAEQKIKFVSVWQPLAAAGLIMLKCGHKRSKRRKKTGFA